ncbi:MAG TPA: kinase [Woeseiaceae bacterium]|nr:kinase [Woeseiaceae bacterium]
MLSRQRIDAFIAQECLPPSFAALVDDHYLPLADWLLAQCGTPAPCLVGINGAQGTGKTTLAAFLALVLGECGRETAVLSLDDFYLTAAARAQRAARVHPLLRTRGVPGTHDLALLTSTLERLATYRAGAAPVCLPRFDKALDDRAPAAAWPAIRKRPQLILLEGWCVGSRPQTAAQLATPVNALEREQDADGAFRRYVNDQLAGPYAALFARLGRLVVLAAPGFDAVLRWRLEQEGKLRQRARGDAPGVMSPAQVARFIEYYERITRENLRTLGGIADVVLELDEQHACTRSRYRS